MEKYYGGGKKKVKVVNCHRYREVTTTISRPSTYFNRNIRTTTTMDVTMTKTTEIGTTRRRRNRRRTMMTMMT